MTQRHTLYSAQEHAGQGPSIQTHLNGVAVTCRLTDLLGTATYGRELDSTVPVRAVIAVVLDGVIVWSNREVMRPMVALNIEAPSGFQGLVMGSSKNAAWFRADLWEFTTNSAMGTVVTDELQDAVEARRNQGKWREQP